MNINWANVPATVATSALQYLKANSINSNNTTSILSITSAYTVANSDLNNQNLQFNCNGAFNVTIPSDDVLGIPSSNALSILLSLLPLGTSVNNFVGVGATFVNTPSITPGQYIITSVQWIAPNTWMYL